MICSAPTRLASELLGCWGGAADIVECAFGSRAHLALAAVAVTERHVQGSRAYPARKGTPDVVSCLHLRV
jgi:hypothetical protein